MGVLSVMSSRRSRATDSVAGGESKMGGSIFGSGNMSGGSRRSRAAMMNATASSAAAALGGGFVLSPQAAAAARRAASVRPDAAALASAVRTDGNVRSTLCNLLLAGNKSGSALGSPLEVEDFVRSSNNVAGGQCSGGVASLRKALAASRLDDASSFAGRYQLFVQWSPDGQHPWDSIQGAENPSATLELAILEEEDEFFDFGVGGRKRASALRNAKPQVAAFLDGAAVEYEFADGVLRTKAAAPCMAPDGNVALVHLQLQFSSGEPSWATDVCKTQQQQHYSAPQCHGLLWFDATTGSLPPADWPPAPPRVSGKANLVARPAARSPAGIPSLATFAGEFETTILPVPTPVEEMAPNGTRLLRWVREGAPRKGLRLKISSDGKTVTLGGKALKNVSFTRSSILSWSRSDDGKVPAGWLHCGHLAAGALLLGRLEEEDNGVNSTCPSSNNAPSRAAPAPPALFNLMAERAGTPSVFLTVDAIDTSAAALEAAGLASAATAELESALALADVAWNGVAVANDEAAAADAVIENARAAAVAAVRRALAADAERDLLVRAFGAAAEAPGLVAMPDEASLGAATAQEEASEHARAARHAADVAEAAAAVAEASSSASASEDVSSSSAARRRPAAAAAKSATAAFNAARASASAASAEAAAERAAAHARRTRMAGSRYVAALAASSHSAAAAAAAEATKAASSAAGAALGVARRHLAELARGEDYVAVRGAADAAEACSRARDLLARDATRAWEAGTRAARATAPATTAAAAAAAADGAKFLRELLVASTSATVAPVNASGGVSSGGSESSENAEVFLPTAATVNAMTAAAAAAATAAAAAALEADVGVDDDEEEVVTASAAVVEQRQQEFAASPTAVTAAASLSQASEDFDDA